MLDQLAAPSNHTVRAAADNWLDPGLPGRSAKTVRKNKDVLEPLHQNPRPRRALGLPAFAAHALRHLQQHERRTTGPVFATRDGHELDAANVRREFRAVIAAAGIPRHWSPRELRRTFVSLMSDSGVRVEEIACLAGHTNSRTTEIVYRRQLRPVKEKAAQAMDQLFSRTA